MSTYRVRVSFSIGNIEVRNVQHVAALWSFNGSPPLAKTASSQRPVLRFVWRHYACCSSLTIFVPISHTLMAMRCPYHGEAGELSADMWKHLLLKTPNWFPTLESISDECIVEQNHSHYTYA